MLSRRTLLGATALSVAIPVLEACSTGTTPTVTPANVVTTASNAVTALTNVLAAEQPVMTPQQQTVVAAIKGDAQAAQGVLSALQSGMSASAGAPIVQQVETDLNSVVDAVALVPLPPPYDVAVAAVALALPILEGFVNSITPTAGASLATLANRQAVASRVPAMTQDQALAKLAQLAAKKSG